MPRVEQRIMPAFSMRENSPLATETLWGSRRRALAKTGGPGWWRGRDAVKPLEERTSGKSEYRSKIHFGAERKVARREGYGGGEDARHKEGGKLLKTFWLATSKRRLWWWRKSALRIGTKTGASWKSHWKLQEPKCRGHPAYLYEPVKKKGRQSCAFWLGSGNI